MKNYCMCCDCEIIKESKDKELCQECYDDVVVEENDIAQLQADALETIENGDW